MLATALHGLDQLLLPVFEDGSPFVSSMLYLSTAPVLAALIAALIARVPDRVLALAALLLLLDGAATLISIAFGLAFGKAALDQGLMIAVAYLVTAFLILAASAVAVGRTLREGVTRPRRRLAVVASLFVLVAWPTLSLLDNSLLGLSTEVAREDESASTVPDIDEEKLWTSQSALVERAVSGLAERVPAASNTYLVTIGAGGSQDLFGREARVARRELGRLFAAEKRSVVLANDEASLFKAPLANNTNLSAVLAAIAGQADGSRDLVVLYLTAHGSSDAELTTDLPNYTRLNAIGAQRLADILDQTGIDRRLIIVSSCYAGSWIKPLASDHTILIAAARADRTSFGCSDDRELTFFGEALLQAKLPAGASMAERFAAARQTVRDWESPGPYSDPQVFVGRKMTALWNERPLSALPRLTRRDFRPAA